MKKLANDKQHLAGIFARTALATLLVGNAFVMVGCDGSKLSDAAHVERAKDYQDKGDWNSAVVELKNALQQNPDSAEARWLLGQAYLEQGDGAAAEKEIARALELGVDPESARISLGRAFLLQGANQRVLDEIKAPDAASAADSAVIQRMRADAHRVLGDLDAACELYTSSMELDAKHVPAYWGLALCAFRQNGPVEARKMIETALQIDESNARSWVLLGELERAEGNDAAAIDAYSAALQRDPDNGAALQNRAFLFLSAGKKAEAAADIGKLKQLPGGKSGAQFVEAWTRYLDGDTAQALGLVQDVLDVQPDNSPATLLLGAVQYDRKADQQAILALTKYLRTDPGHLGARKVLAMSYVRIGEPGRALELLRPVIDSGQADAQVLALAGRAYMREGDPAAAEEVLQKASELVPMSAAVGTELGQVRLAAGREGDAVTSLRAAASSDTKRYDADLTLAYYFNSKQQFDEALAAIDALEAKLPNSAGVHNLRGVAYAGKGDMAAARKSFEKALQLNPTLTSAAIRLAAMDLQENGVAAARARYQDLLQKDNSNVPAMIGMAELAARDKDTAQYLEWLERASIASPSAVIPRIMLANHYLGTGDHAKALAAARDAVAGAPESPQALALLGKVQLETGDAASAVASFTTVSNMMPKSTDAWLNLAQAEAAVGNEAKTRAALRRALEIDPDSGDARVALSRIDKRIGKDEEALAFARTLQQQFSGSPAGFLLEGDVWMAAKSWDKAVVAYERALGVRKDSTSVGKLHLALVRSGAAAKGDAMAVEWLQAHPDQHGVRLYLAQSYAQRELKDKAIEQYEILLKVDPDNKVVRNNLEFLTRP